MEQDQPHEVGSNSNLSINPKRKEEKPMLHFRRNIKLPDNVFYRLKALQNVLPYKQYELVEKMINVMVTDLSERDQQYFKDQLAKITEIGEEKKQGK